jgi:hypothetical protein
MAYEKIIPIKSDVWDFDDNKEFEGYFKSVQENIGPNNSNLWTFEGLDGKDYSIWGSKVLDNRFSTLKKGMKTKVVYLGKKKSEKTGRPYKDFDVYKDETDIKSFEEVIGDEDELYTEGL